MKQAQRLFAMSCLLAGLLAGKVGSTWGEEGPTLRGVRIAILVRDVTELQAVNRFERALRRVGWLPEHFTAEPVNSFRTKHPEFGLFVEGTFGLADLPPTFTLYWEAGKEVDFPSVPSANLTFDDVVAEFIEFVQRPHVQHYLFDQRRGQQRSPYQVLLDDAWNKTNNAQWTLAIADVEQAMQFREAKGETHPLFLLGYCYKETGQFDKASATFKKVLDIQRDHAGALLDLGNLAFDLGDYDEAKLRYEQVVDLKTSNIHRAKWNLGLLHQIKHEWDAAKAIFQSLLSQPSYSEAARRRIKEIDGEFAKQRQRDEAEKLARERRVTFYQRLRSGLGVGALLVGTAWVVVQHRRKQKDLTTPAEKRDALPNMISQGLVGIWGGIVTALVMSFVGK